MDDKPTNRGVACGCATDQRDSFSRISRDVSVSLWETASACIKQGNRELEEHFQSACFSDGLQHWIFHLSADGAVCRVDSLVQRPRRAIESHSHSHGECGDWSCD